MNSKNFSLLQSGTLFSKKSKSISTNPGYVSSSVITIAGSNSTLKTAAREMPLNVPSIFVSPTTTGKLQAIKECATSPMTTLTAEADSRSPVIKNVRRRDL